MKLIETSPDPVVLSVGKYGALPSDSTHSSTTSLGQNFMDRAKKIFKSSENVKRSFDDSTGE